MSIAVTKDTFSLQDNTSEQDAVVIPTNTPIRLDCVSLDLSNLTQNATIRVYAKVDGTNYRLRYGTTPAGGTTSWTTSDGDWVQIRLNDVMDNDVKVTIQSAVAEAAPVDVPYSFGWQS